MNRYTIQENFLVTFALFNTAKYSLMKIQTIFLFLPCIASLFWFLFYLLFSSKGSAYRKLSQFLFIVSLFLLFTILSLDNDAFMLMHFTLFKQVCALLMIPSFLKYIKALEGKRPSGLLYNILSVVPYMQLVVGIQSVFAVGYENAVGILIDSYTFQGPMFPYLPDHSQMLFYACYTYMFKTLLLFDFMLFSVYLMKSAVSGLHDFKLVWGFLFRRRKSSVLPVQYCMALLLFLIVVPALILGKDNSLDTVFLTALGSFLVAFFDSMIAFVGTSGAAEYQSMPAILRRIRFGVDEDKSLEDETDEEASEQATATESVYDNKVEEPVLRVTDAEKEETLNKLREAIGVKLDKYLIEDQLYLKHDLTLSYVADKVGVFKDDLSDYINYRYDMSFQNYINTLRISYAEKYLMAHDRVTQNEIALECGFSGASSFNSAFSKKNGVTPKIWKDRQLEILKNQEA